MAACAPCLSISSNPTSSDPHRGHRGCAYSPTPGTSSFSGVFSSSSFLAVSASCARTVSLIPSTKLELGQAIRTRFSSIKKDSIPAESSMLLASNAFGVSQYRAIMTGLGTSRSRPGVFKDPDASADSLSAGNACIPLFRSSERNASVAIRVSESASAAITSSSPSSMPAYSSAKRCRSFGSSICPILTASYPRQHFVCRLNFILCTWSVGNLSRDGAGRREPRVSSSRLHP
jgi:hypothetical protein